MKKCEQSGIFTKVTDKIRKISIIHWAIIQERRRNRDCTHLREPQTIAGLIIVIDAYVWKKYIVEKKDRNRKRGHVAR